MLNRIRLLKMFSFNNLWTLNLGFDFLSMKYRIKPGGLGWRRGLLSIEPFKKFVLGGWVVQSNFSVKLETQDEQNPI